MSENQDGVLPELSFGFAKDPVHVITKAEVLYLSLDLQPGPFGGRPAAVSNDLERLTVNMTEEQVRAARLGYALGLLHGHDDGKVPEIDPQGPEMRAMKYLDLGG